MEHFVGLDVSQEMTHLCVIDGQGKTVWQGRCLSTPEAIAGTIKSKAPDVVRISVATCFVDKPLERLAGSPRQHDAERL
jgi:hypothetical protein